MADDSRYEGTLLAQNKPHMVPVLDRTVRTVSSLRSAISEHRRHIEVLEECIQDEALRLMDAAEAETPSEKADVYDALSLHCSMKPLAAEVAVWAAASRRDEQTQEQSDES